MIGAYQLNITRFVHRDRSSGLYDFVRLLLVGLGPCTVLRCDWANN